MRARSNWRILTAAVLCGALVVGISVSSQAQPTPLVHQAQTITPEIAALLEKLKSADLGDRRDAVFDLLKTGQSAQILKPHLLPLLKDAAPEVRRSVIIALHYSMSLNPAIALMPQSTV